ncbi:MAG: RsmD family RNA methyltransferase, partial [Acidimicrobiia bacterium]|nr:RsmD family RNA methyltransferase [Acidimicrobiia bacterium]
MRVVGGLARGRKLQAPEGRHVRPTSDRVREAVFSSLDSMDAVRDADVLD